MSPDYSFPQERRLRNDTNVQEVFDEGQFFKGDYCHLIRGNRESGTKTRCAFIVSRKTATKSTERNRIRRLMRESFRLAIPRLEEGWPLVMLATRNAHGELKRQDIDEDLLSLLEDADLIDAEDVTEDYELEADC